MGITEERTVPSRSIPAIIQRALYAESMGRCMNPYCEEDIYGIAEKAHIVDFADTHDHSIDNLIILCPNCHTKYDILSKFSIEDVRGWKRKRREFILETFEKKFNTFGDLEKIVKPILEENKNIYEAYYLGSNPELWKKFEFKIVSNNSRLELLLKKNIDLFQGNTNPGYSNLAIIQKFLLHIQEFKMMRECQEKYREILFPEEVNSIFGVIALERTLIPSVESLECLIEKYKQKDIFIKVVLDNEKPYIEYVEEGENIEVLLADTARLRQLYHNEGCFRTTSVRLESLIYVLKNIKKRDFFYTIPNEERLSEICIEGKYIKFVYKYCLSRADVESLEYRKDLHVVNLHNWNGNGCISKSARERAQELGYKIYTTSEFFSELITW